MFGRDRLAIMVAEFLGVAILTITMLVAPGRIGLSLLAAIGGGLAFGAVNYLFDSHANPAMTIGLWTMRRVDTLQALQRIVMQMLGGLAVWQLIEYLINNPLTSRANEKFDWRILLAEALGGFVLGLGVAIAATRAYNSERTAVIRGLSLTLAILVAVLASNGLINPAVALGVQSWSWAYVLGPVVGVVVGTSLCNILFAPRATAKTRTVSAKTGSKTSPPKRVPPKKPATRRK